MNKEEPVNEDDLVSILNKFTNEDDYSDIVVPQSTKNNQGKISEVIDYNVFVSGIPKDIENNENNIQKKVNDTKNTSNLPKNNGNQNTIEPHNSISVNIPPIHKGERQSVVDNEAPKVIDEKEESYYEGDNLTDKFERDEDVEIKNESRLKKLWNGVMNVPKNLWNFLKGEPIIEKSEKIFKEIGNLSPPLLGLALIFADLLKNEIELQKKILEELKKLQAEDDKKKKSISQNTISTEKKADETKEIIVEQDKNMLNLKQDGDSEAPDVNKNIKKEDNGVINVNVPNQSHVQKLNNSRNKSVNKDNIQI